MICNIMYIHIYIYVYTYICNIHTRWPASSREGWCWASELTDGIGTPDPDPRNLVIKLVCLI